MCRDCGSCTECTARHASPCSPWRRARQRVFASVGIHPSEVTKLINTQELIDLTKHSKVVGLGETGLDYHYNKEYALYQNILYTFIKEAIITRVNTLSFGRTALEMKSTVGAKPIDHVAYIRLNNRLLNKLICT